MRVFLFSFFISLNCFCQQSIHLDNQIENIAVYNPAGMALFNSVFINLTSREQWLGFKGAPSLQVASLSLIDSNKNYHIGGYFLRDNVGPIEHLNVCFNYSYSIDLSSNNSFKRWKQGDSFFTFGLGIGLSTIKLNFTELNGVNIDDPLITYDNRIILKPILSIGAIYKHKDLFVSFSLPDIVHNNSENYISQFHFYSLLGWKKKINSELNFVSVSSLKFTRNAPFSAKQMCGFLFNKFYMIGLQYGFNASIGVVNHFSLSPNFKVGYSFSFPTNSLFNHQYGSHEVFLSFRKQKKSKGTDCFYD